MSTTDQGREQLYPAETANPAAAQPSVPEEAWDRPVAVAKDRNVRAWLIFLGLLCFGIALWTPLRALYYQYGYTKTETAVVRDADTFVALAYYGVNDQAPPGSQDLSTEAFAAHLRLLKKHGYNPIGLEEVRAFYKEGRLLPRKAVLMTFEQSRKSSYFEIRDLLHANKWKAVMGVVTAPIHVRDAQALLWPYLRDMLTMGSWELAAQSDRGFSMIEASPSGRTAPFFSVPQWMADKNRYELPEEFNTRVREDHARVIGEFQRETGTRPIAFFFPYGDYGQYEERASVVRVTNLNQIGKHYELGFTLGQLALNTRNSDQRRLNRLLVNPKWTPEEFLSKLETFWPLDMLREARNDRFGAERWIGEWGDVFVRDAELVLRAIPPVNPVMTLRQDASTATTGAKAWLAGSDTFEDGFLSVRFQHKRGRFGVYLRSTPLGGHIYFSLDDTGKVSVRQKLPDLDELILASDSLEGESEKNHELLICLRENLMFVRLNGKTLFGGRVLLRGESAPGLIAAGVWDPIPGVAEAMVIETRLIGRREGIAIWKPDIARDWGYLTQWLNEHSYQFTVLSPPWLDIFENAPLTFPLWDKKALNLLARTNNLRILPHVQVRDAALLLKVSTDEVVARAEEHAVHGLYVDSSFCTHEQITPLVTWLIRLNDGLRAKKMGLALKLPSAIETLPSAGSILKLLPGVQLAGEYKLPPFDLKLSDVLSVTQVTPPASDETLSLYYQLSNMLSVYDDVSPEAKLEELRQKGFDAFTAGEYPQAITWWQAWYQADPRSAEAVSLIGDAWMRLNEPQKALEAYTQSLEINPGQMNLAIRRSRLLEQLNRLDESADILNVYARAFPDSPAVTIAQAQWLDRHRQRKEAREVMRKLVGRYPENIEARLVLQTMLDDPADRYANMQDLLAIGRSAETHLFGFGRDIFGAELLAIPEASVFFDFVRETASSVANKKTRDLYQGFLPLTNAVVENFVTDKLSDHWVAFGGFRPTAYGRYELRAGSDMAEAFLRLKRSELMRDGYLEATLDETAGMFWLYARRSTRSMLRFGFDDEGFIRIQSWLNGELRSYESRPWLRPPGTVRLRLEIRGDGAVGYVNGKPVFTTPLVIPQDVCYGWWSIAPFAPELGLARARISRIECGPLCPTVLLMPPKMTPEEIAAGLDKIRVHVRDMSALAPFAFTQLPDGSVPSDPDMDLSAFRMFCTFHRLRLMPVVDLAYFSEMLPKALTDLILKHRLAGMILRVRTPPDEGWFKKMEKELEKTTADFIVIRQEEFFWPAARDTMTDADLEAAKVRKLPQSSCREIQRGSLLLHPVRQDWPVRALTYREWTGVLSDPKSREGIPPRLVVVPRQFQAGADLSLTQNVVFTQIRVPKTGETVLITTLTNAAPDAVQPAASVAAPPPAAPPPAAPAAKETPAAPPAASGASATNPAVRAAGAAAAQGAPLPADKQEAGLTAEAEKSLWRKVRERLAPAAKE
ncbi:MAG: polysaccharide deacetylase family protein [Kiritimatiellia bacterium]|jgi:tetratricopeptide (TPR) repeat protein/peptidoglycan/xylan/chitin deacetylase (PgdA/CDA1 family)|nr:polysaccharide deacetylase family protein [Kiritimatiellia bacterium]